ncbi:MAG TPA: SMC-Scp complex subunit ScpB [Rhodopila sp.]|uniref:SMC-Scp complex subunit ScpB n=1 Tax=Rhodopila sp. TaxID=2480087 RepID=UPI002C81CDF7|nr:SMC-Scp complex subunit ScpB [Rhodopila sp.]HVY15227.1 SMC-Scp complex subunit ScpB [Rhodopila sp.]
MTDVTILPTDDTLRLIEALVFASAEVVPMKDISALLPEGIHADVVVKVLKARYAGRGVEVVEVAGGVAFRTALDLAPRLRKLIAKPRRLTPVAMETLSIIAYHQPVTRAEIEHIRGASLSQQTLDQLLELELITPKGRRDTPGRPTIWGTTAGFLSYFGIKALDELPRRDDLLIDRG